LVLFGLIFTLASCGGVLIAAPAFQRDGFDPAALLAPGNIGLLVGGGIFTPSFLVVGLVMVVLCGRALLARPRVTRPEIPLSILTPRVSEVVTLSFQQSFAPQPKSRTSATN
jgi:hypothetical protein